MDQNQKHSMMYPSLSGRNDVPSSSSDMSQHHGIPTEAPPSYDMAMASPSAPSRIQPSAPSPTTPVGVQDFRQYPVPSATSPPMQHVTMDSYAGNANPMVPSLPPVVVEQPASEPLKLGPQPSTVTCPECGERRKTRMHYTPNKKTHIFAVVLCLVGWCCCACCVPYCMSSCKTGHHYCGRCSRFLGTYNRNEI